MNPPALKHSQGRLLAPARRPLWTWAQVPPLEKPRPEDHPMMGVAV